MPEKNLGIVQSLRYTAVPQELSSLLAPSQWEDILRHLTTANMNAAENCSCLPVLRSMNENRLSGELRR